MEPQKLKHLQVRKSQLEIELKELRDRSKELDKKITDINTSLNRVNKEMNDLHEQQPTISEHAILRYAERVLGIDIDKIKKDLLTDENVKIINQLRNCKLPIGNKYKVVVRNKVIITVEDC